MPSKSRKQNKSKSRTSGRKQTSTTVQEAAPVEVAPVEVAPVEEATPAKTSRRSRKTKAATPVQEAAPVQESAPTPAKKAKGRRAPKRKVIEQTETEVQVTEAMTETATATETSTGRRTRSFKVMLPESEAYEGRFTGLTPYQAANKALSSYYKGCKKNNVTAQSELEFSIRESTRGSAHKVYTYRGARVPLDTPVEYTIKQQDGTERVITKEYKNRLTKVKKADLQASA